jgi:hypothetical protein
MNKNLPDREERADSLGRVNSMGQDGSRPRIVKGHVLWGIVGWERKGNNQKLREAGEKRCGREAEDKLGKIRSGQIARDEFKLNFVGNRVTIR